MIEKCIPEYYVNNIYSISFEKLLEKGFTNLIIDIDNTLVPWGCKSCDESSRELLLTLLEMGFKICLLSNSSEERVVNFINGMDLVYFSPGIKPMKSKFLGALSVLTNEPEKTCIIGDQMFTDVFGAKRCGIHTILVDPFSTTEFFTTRFLRKIEKKLKKSLTYTKELIKA